jgi:predicted nuclease with RNAse H fold
VPKLRTTITVDERVLRAVRAKAARTGLAVEAQHRTRKTKRRLRPRWIAVDWSGRSGADQARHIWLCEVAGGEVERLESGRTRSEVVRWLHEAAEHEPALVVGFDFAFSLPGWYLRELGIGSARQLWQLLAREALTPRMRELGLRAWMREPDPPFWRTGRPAELTRDRAFRRTELEVAAPGTRAKSVFQLVGGGQVGPGSLYGMQALHELAEAGFSVWPFDEPRGPLVVEIFPRTLTGPVVKSSRAARTDYLRGLALPPGHREAAEGSEHAFDALISALAMSRRLASLSRLRVEPEYALEGRIWIGEGETARIRS